ncbi:hypothetical protein K474DRAFT_1253038 [Panus rudis PR-1116 ss-1]|nr:hypothetical protein K474DRAFT_1253038 [Panus rudis PR-1116 ss-1]
MPTAPIDDNGSFLRYADSGPPAKVYEHPYTTVVLIHGVCYNNGIFDRVLPFGSAQNLRIVTVNLRDYTGSTALSALDLERLNSEDPRERLLFLHDRVQELARFLLWFIETESIPPPCSEAHTRGSVNGGITLVGWSAGNHLTMCLLAYGADILPQKQKNILQKYLKSYVMFESPYHMAGLPTQKLGDQYFCAIDDPALDKNQFLDVLPTWVSSFYTHSRIVLDALSGISHGATISAPVQSLTDEEFLQGLAIIPDDPDVHTPTTLSIPPEVIESTEGIARSDVPLMLLGRDIYHDVFERAFFTGYSSTLNGQENGFHDIRAKDGWLPQVRVEVVTCGRSIPICLWHAWKLYHALRETDVDHSAHSGSGNATNANGTHSTQRKVRFHLWREFNHFPHWEEPFQFVQSLAKLI